jgi:hypothetical protein
MTSVLLLLALYSDAEPQLRDTAQSPPEAPSLQVTAPSDMAKNGLVPLWEYSGAIRSTGSAQVGWNDSQVGVGAVQVGTKLFLDLYGIYNAELKVRVFESPRVRSAFIAGIYRVPTNAQSRGVGNLYASGFSNPYAPVWLAPLALANSISVARALTVHSSSVVLLSRSDDADQEHLSLGQSAFAEWRTRGRFAARFHAGVTGVLVQPVAHTALSFAYNGQYVQLAAGLGRRFAFAGEQSNFVMLDASLVFE